MQHWETRNFNRKEILFFLFELLLYVNKIKHFRKKHLLLRMVEFSQFFFLTDGTIF